jgi:hypothetical protein
MPEKPLVDSECFGVLYYDAIGSSCESVSECEVAPKCRKLCDERLLSIEATKVTDLTAESMAIFKRELAKKAQQLADQLRREQTEKVRLSRMAVRHAKSGAKRKRHVRTEMVLCPESCIGHAIASTIISKIGKERFDIIFCGIYINVKREEKMCCRITPLVGAVNITIQKKLVNPLGDMGFTVFAVSKAMRKYAGTLVGTVQVKNDHDVDIFTKAFLRYYDR